MGRGGELNLGLTTQGWLTLNSAEWWLPQMRDREVRNRSHERAVQRVCLPEVTYNRADKGSSN